MSDFAFTLPKGDSATLRLDPLTNADGTAPDLTGWTLTFTAGAVTKTSGAGQVLVLAPGNIVTVAIAAGNFATAGEFAASLVASSGGQQSTWYGTVVIVDAAAPRDLTTIEKVKRHLGPEYSTAADWILSDLVTSSSAWIVSQLGQEVLLRTVVETRNGDGSTRLLLRQFPVGSVTSLTVDGVTIPKRATTDGDGWILSRDGIDLAGYVFTAGLQNVVITYTAGYATTPPDLEQAVIEHVALRYADRKHTGIDSLSAGGESAQFGTAGTFAYINGVLDTYRGLGGLA